MTIEKLPSGSYRATVMQEGKRYRKTFDHKPTQKEVLQALAEELSEHSKKIGLTFKEAARQYVEMKRNVLSPSTIRDYSAYPKRLPSWFSGMLIDNINQIEINKVINELSVKKSPKTIRNYHGFISTVLYTFRPGMKICTTLPQRKKVEPYIPTDSDLKRIISEINGTPFYVPIMLACYGMRRSEICALTAEDIEGTVVHINKALVMNDKKKWVLKSTKTTESERDIIIPSDLANLIISQGYVYNGYPNSIICKLTKVQNKLGIQHFSLHKLRHYFASKMLTITDANTVQALGGWRSDSVLKSVYAHSLKEEQEKAKIKAVETFTNSLLL